MHSLEQTAERRMFRPATAADLNNVASWIRSQEECEFWAGHSVPYPLQRDSLARQIHLSAETSFVLQGDTLVAFGQLFDKGEGRGHLGRIIVSPDCRGRGYGRVLVESLLGIASQRQFAMVGLNVRYVNHVAIALYGKLGFETTSRPAALGPAPGSFYMCRNLRGVSRE